MKKQLLLLGLGLLLVSCNTPAQSSSIEETSSLEQILKNLTNKYHTTYQNKDGTFSYYQQPNYTYDTYTEIGLLVMNNGGCYEYTIFEDNIICSLPSLNDKSYFEKYRSSINLSLDDFTLSEGKYISTNQEVCDQVAALANYYNIPKVEIELVDNKLNFYLYDANNNLAVSGIVDDEENQIVNSYLSTYSSPNAINNTNEELANVISNLSNNYTFIGKDYSTNYPIYVQMNENGYYEATSDTFEFGSGYIVLEDGVHSFMNNKNGFSVNYEVNYDKENYNKLFNLGKIFINKFININEHSYLSYDPYNIYSLSNFFGVDASNVTHIVFDVFDSYTSVSFYNNDSIIVNGDLTNIKSTSITRIDSYVEGNIRPELIKYTNNLELLNLTKDLTNNFTFHKKSDYEENVYYETKSTSKGRFVTTDIILTAKNNYYVENDVAYPYTLEDDKLNLSIETSMPIEEYNDLFSFKNIDFATFAPIGNNQYQSNDSKTLLILNNLLDGNLNSNYQDSAIVSIVDGKLNFKLSGGNMTWSEGYIDNINTTSIELFNQDIIIPTWINNDNSELKTFINELQEKCNFTVSYASDTENGDIYTEKDYDYWTNEAVYYGFYENGIVYSEAGYLYEYGNQTNDDDETYFTIGEYPFKYDTIQDFNPLKLLDDTWINRIEKTSENTYTSTYKYIIDVFKSLTDLSSYQVDKVELTLLNNELTIKLYDEEDFYGPMTIKDVNKTTIPSFANTPKIY